MPIESLFVLAAIYPSIKSKKYIFEGEYKNVERIYNEYKVIFKIYPYQKYIVFVYFFTISKWYFIQIFLNGKVMHIAG